MNTLRSPRLTLLPQRAEHAEAMFAVLRDPAIYTYENEPPASVEWLRARFARLEARRSPDGRQRWLNWVLRRSDSAALIGFVQATVLADGAAYVAYVLGSEHWGQGLASEATAAMMDELAANHRVREFLAVLKRANLPSLRLLERHGFVPASAAALAAHPVGADEVLMTMTRVQTTPFDRLTLRTKRLHLRSLVSSDAEALFTIFSDPRVMRFWSTPPWTDPAQSVARVASEIEGMRAGRSIRLALVRAVDDAVVGTCSLFNIDHANRRAEIGYALARSAWGAGFMNEALHALIGWAFGALNLHRLEADIDPRNTASAASLERLGFVREGHLRERWIVDGEVSDSALYGLLRSDWPDDDSALLHETDRAPL